MKRTSTYLVPALLATMGAAGAQVEWFYSNITDSSSATVPRAYSDAIVLWTPGGQRPVAQESHGRTATGSVRKMKCRTVGGLNYLYWYDIISDDIWRGRDANGNGVVDPTEFQQVYNHVASSDGSLDEVGGVWWNCLGATAIGELWRFQDGNGDGDFMDGGESTQVVPSGPLLTVATDGGPIAGVSGNNATGLVAMQNGDCVWYPKGTAALPTLALIRTTAGGAHRLYLAYGLAAAGGRIPALPVNPDFPGLLPNVGTNPLDRLAVDQANDTVYAAVNFSAAVPQPWIYQCKDRNADGDANDAGEVKLFYDGLTGPIGGLTTIDDIEWLNGKLYVSHERGQPAGPCEFVELVDLNNDGDAMDAGEQTVHGSTSSAPLDDPTVIGITVAPAGFFGGAASSCVSVDLRTNGMVQGGGTLNLTLADIPVAQQSPLTIAFGLLGVSGDLGIPLPNGCILGLLPDTITFATLPYLTGTPTGRSLALPAFTYPPLAAGTTIYSAALFLDLATLSFPGVSHSVSIVVQ